MTYCLDQAVLHFGMTMENRLEEATLSGKERREATKAQAKRKAALEKILGRGQSTGKTGGYADPALMF